MKKSRVLPRLVIFGDPDKGPVAETARDFTRFLRNKARILANCEVAKCTTEMLRESDFAIVLGGDGSIIAAARYLSQANVPVIGVNLGKLGFLAEFSVDEFKKSYADIVSGKAPVERRMMLGCRVRQAADGSREIFYSKAVNDVYIVAGPPFHVIELKVAVDGQEVARSIGDGLIISTPTGSTAYNLSAGGPILAGPMEAIVLTPVCPHSLSFRPIVIDAANVVEIVCTRINQGTTVSADGQVAMGLSPGDIISVAREQSSFLVVNNPLRTRWDTLATKLGWAREPLYAGRWRRVREVRRIATDKTENGG
jgi:NAD+ kinase